MHGIRGVGEKWIKNEIKKGSDRGGMKGSIHCTSHRSWHQKRSLYPFCIEYHSILAKNDIEDEEK